MGRLLDVSHYRYVAGWHARLIGDLAAAEHLVAEALEQTLAAGVPFPSALCHQALALLCHERGQGESARAHLAEARNLGRRMGSKIVECSCLLAEAELAFSAGDAERGRVALASGLAIAAHEGYGNVHWWRPEALASLCARALDAGIETTYVRRLVQRRRLQPPGDEAPPEAWPWRVQVHALGRFEARVDGKLVTLTGRAPRKPLALLKALVAFGSRGVAEREIADALWPDADGDLAQQSLAVTLHRLRKLLGDDEAIRRHEGRLDLDNERVWTDVAALGACLEKSAQSNPEERASLVDRALRLYRGPLLAGDEEPWIPAPRERFRARFVQELGNVARAAEQSGDVDRAIHWYQQALEVDDRAEELYRSLMALYLRHGRRAEMLALYQRCLATLSSSLGVSPSPETEKLLRTAAAASHGMQVPLKAPEA
jgi:DNA-binding SARP family transcriptional activator